MKIVGLQLELSQMMKTDWLTLEKPDAQDGLESGQLFEVLLKTQLTIHTEEEKEGRAEEQGGQRPDGVSQSERDKNLAEQRNIQIILLFREGGWGSKDKLFKNRLKGRFFVTKNTRLS